jgi:hypothetical protein
MPSWTSWSGPPTGPGPRPGGDPRPTVGARGRRRQRRLSRRQQRGRSARLGQLEVLDGDGLRSLNVRGPSGHAGDAEHYHSGEGRVLVLRVGPRQPGAEVRRPWRSWRRRPNELGPVPTTAVTSRPGPSAPPAGPPAGRPPGSAPAAAAMMTSTSPDRRVLPQPSSSTTYTTGRASTPRWAWTVHRTPWSCAANRARAWVAVSLIAAALDRRHRGSPGTGLAGRCAPLGAGAPASHLNRDGPGVR